MSKEVKMKKLLTLLFILVVSGFLLAQGSGDKAAAKAQYKYVGVSSCKTCHKTKKSGEQYKIWAASKHAKAYETLKGEAAAKIAQEKGLKVPAYEAPECLQCHVTAFGVDKAQLGPKFKMEDGVQCETCHGPGSAYKKMKIMKDRAKAIANGMYDIKVADGSAEKTCRSCHNEKSPTYKEFNFKERWAKIAHPVPKK